MKKLLYSVFVIFLSAFVSNLRAQYITTVTGTGVAGYTGDGFAALSAKLNSPFGIAVDPVTGNVFFADSANHCVRKITAATGIITTIAGNGSAAFSGDNAASTAARLSSPVGVALDASGNIYISDLGNGRIRKITAATGIITTVAGTGGTTFGGDGGLATAATAKINKPYAVAFDAAGNFYIADYGNHRIRKVTISTGIISTFAGNGTGGFLGDATPATTARINFPEGLAFDASGNLYIADYGNNRVRMVNTAGIISTAAGNGTSVYGGDGSAATATGLDKPIGIAFDAAGNYYVTDRANNSVRMVNPATGIISTTAGTGTAGYNNDCISPIAAQLNLPSGLAFDGSGNLYITDRLNNRVRKIIPPCSGTPSAGIANSTAANGCNSYTPTLSLSGASTGCDISYQWEYSADGSSFSSIAGATSATYSPTVTAASYFDCIVTCNNSGLSSASTSLLLNITHPIVFSPIAGNTSICPSDTAQLSDTVTGGNWTATNAHASVNASGIVTGNTAGLDTIVYSAFNLCGTYRDSQVVTVNPIVTPSTFITLSTGTTFVCVGTSVIFTGNAINGGSGPAYTWYINGVFSGIGSTLTYTPINGDMITCTLTSNAPCLTTPTASASVTMTVTSLITPTISISDGLYGDTVCAGTSLIYYTSVTNGGFTPVYDWTVNNVLLGSGSTFTYTPSDGEVIKCTLTSSFACANPASVSDSITMTVDITQSPTISITAFPGDTSCPGYAVTFTASTLYGGITPAYLWRKNGINVATGSSYTHTVVTGDSVQCILYSSSPCRTDDSVFSNVIHMAIAPTTTATFSITPHPGTTILAGQTVTLTSGGSHIGSTSTYQWYVNGIAIAGATSGIYASSSFNDNDSVFCLVHNGNPCALPTVIYSSKVGLHVIGGTGIQQISGSGSETRIIPNPNTGSFTLESSVNSNDREATIQVTNLLGRVIASYSATVTNGQIKKQLMIGNDAANGIYFVHIITGADQKVTRFILNR